MKRLIVLAALAILTESSTGILSFSDGGSHDIGYQYHGAVYVYDGPSGARSTVNLIQGGRIYGLYPWRGNVEARQWSIVNINGGAIEHDLNVHDYSYATIKSGTIGNRISLWDNSRFVIYGKNYQYGSGLSVEGDRLIGTGILKGEWFDGTPWSLNIYRNPHSARITLIPEPATLVLLGVGGVFIRRKR